MEVRGFCVQYTKRKNRERRNAEKNLQTQIDHLMTLLKTERSKENILKFYRLRAELNAIAEYRTKGAIIRSRTRWHEQGEKNTKYFLNLEKRHHFKTHISKLKTNDDREITTPNDILEQGKMFYKNLYTAAPCNNSKYNLFFENPNLAKLDETGKNELEHPLSNEECLHILEQCAKGKCPGSDGLSVEFYLRFWSMLGEELVQSLNYGFEHQHLNITQKQGMCGSRKYPYPSHGRFLVCIPPPLRNFRSKGVFEDPPSPQESPRYANMVFVVTFTINNIHFQHITLCYCSILFACLLSGLKCSMFFTKICLNRVF